MSTVVVPFEIRRGSLATQIAIDALIVDVEFSLDVFSIFIRDISHKKKNLAELGARKLGNFYTRAIIFIVDEWARCRQIWLAQFP
jgi:hypothetical protein